jgi:hypothetical protein
MTPHDLRNPSKKPEPSSIPNMLKRPVRPATFKNRKKSLQAVKLASSRGQKLSSVGRWGWRGHAPGAGGGLLRATDAARLCDGTSGSGTECGRAMCAELKTSLRSLQYRFRIAVKPWTGPEREEHSRPTTLAGLLCCMTILFVACLLYATNDTIVEARGYLLLPPKLPSKVIHRYLSHISISVVGCFYYCLWQVHVHAEVFACLWQVALTQT